MCKYRPRILGVHSTFLGQHGPQEHTTFTSYVHVISTSS